MVTIGPRKSNYIQSVNANSGQTDFPILLKNPIYPLMLSWDVRKANNVHYELLVNGKPRQGMAGAGSLSMADVRQMSFRVVAGTPTAPNKFVLAQNYPNPFNPTTKIDYDLSEDVRVTLKVYDLLGREVATLVDGLQTAGSRSVSFNAGNLSSGMYYYRIEAGRFTDTKKLLVMK